MRFEISGEGPGGTWIVIEDRFGRFDSREQAQKLIDRINGIRSPGCSTGACSL
jgi:hypothetical protein